MELINTTQLACGFTMATDKTGRELLVAIAKGTYSIPDAPDLEPLLLEDQLPLMTADVFTGEPGVSALAYENDYAPVKPRCDVLFNGCCYAPGGMPTRCVPVAIRVGSMKKEFSVVGAREYNSGLFSVGACEPRPFTLMPITYNNAFGGIDRTSENPAAHRWYGLNPAGTGFGPAAKTVDVKSFPNTQEVDDPIEQPDGSYRPMAFGPIGRSWVQRQRWAGTYDQKWLDEQYPFLPQDFDTRYFQSAPEDQQIDFPHGGEEVVLQNLTPQGRTAFRLPNDLYLPILFFSRETGAAEVPAVVDTVLLEPDQTRMLLVWRASFRLRRTIREITHIAIGKTAREHTLALDREQRLRGKLRFKSPAELVKWSRGQAK